MYNEIFRRLHDLPESEKELAAGMYVFDADGHCGCALGKALSPVLRKRLHGKGTNGASVGQIDRAAVSDELTLAVRDELRQTEATLDQLLTLQRFNDDGTPVHRSNDPDARKARYGHVMKWLGDKIAQAP